MAKVRSRHVCSECGHAAFAWAGQCAGCGEWNTLVEEVIAPSPSGGRGIGSGKGSSRKGAATRSTPLREVEAERTARVLTRIGEADRVLGGGPSLRVGVVLGFVERTTLIHNDSRTFTLMQVQWSAAPHSLHALDRPTKIEAGLRRFMRIAPLAVAAVML